MVYGRVDRQTHYTRNAATTHEKKRGNVMSDTCTHDSTTERQGDTWVDCNGYSHTVIFGCCGNPGCERYQQAVRSHITGQDVPFAPAAQMWPVGAKP